MDNYFSSNSLKFFFFLISNNTQVPSIDSNDYTLCTYVATLCALLQLARIEVRKNGRPDSLWPRLLGKFLIAFFFHWRGGPTRCALWVALRPSRSFVFDGSVSRANDIANGRATSTRPITNHSRGTIKQNRGKKFPSKVSRFICT